VDQLINHHNQEFLQHMGMEMLVVDMVPLKLLAVVVLEVVVQVVQVDREELMIPVHIQLVEMDIKCLLHSSRQILVNI
tara:strand:+ start:305 stop:538 length:234 start_codon:yes stop_codon:yes gene_type:complete